MPYRKKYSKRSARPGYKSCGKMVLSDAQKALAMAKYLKSIVNVEYKNHDVVATSASRATGPTIINCTSIAQGDTEFTRDGAQCKITSLNFKYHIEAHASAAETLVRVMVILDKQTNQAQYQPLDVLSDDTVNDSIVAPRNRDNLARFTILYDKVHAYSSAGRTVSYHKFYKKLQTQIRFDNPAANINSNVVNSISIMVMSNQPTNSPLMTHNLRLLFVDN